MLVRRVAAPGAFACVALGIYAVMPYGSADPKQAEPPELAVAARPDPGAPVTPTLSEQQIALLNDQKWDTWVGSGTGVWVAVDEQMFRIVRDGQIVWQAQCATAAKGTGSQMNSYKTPLGWHSVKKKVGSDAPVGQVFRSAKATKEIWKPGDTSKEDLVLTRILWLTGEEPGKNLGGSVDSYSRYIYIHGTNEEDKIGTPSSHGCVRLRNSYVIQAYDLIPEGTRVLISEAVAH